MVRDGPGSANQDAGHWMNIRAVEELEDAISHLEERIERLESDVGPFPHNHTDVGQPAAPGHGGAQRAAAPGRAASGAERSWTMEELEEELERKMELLEKERKNMKKETEKHRQEVERGLKNAHQRLSGLEGGVSILSFPEGFRLSFPTRTRSMHALVSHALPTLKALSVCLWLRPSEAGLGAALSYSVADQPREVVLLQGVTTPPILLINDKGVQLPLNLSRGSWQHVCVSWSEGGGAWQAYQGGRLRGAGRGLSAGHHVRAGGVLMLGQEQTSVGGRFDPSRALVGELSQVCVWDRVLTSQQVSSLSRCGRVAPGNVAPWTESGVHVYGGATKDPGEPCSKHTRRD